MYTMVTNGSGEQNLGRSIAKRCNYGDLTTWEKEEQKVVAVHKKYTLTDISHAEPPNTIRLN